MASPNPFTPTEVRMEINPVSVDGRMFFTVQVGVRFGCYCFKCMGLVAQQLATDGPMSPDVCLEHRCPPKQ